MCNNGFKGAAFRVLGSGFWVHGSGFGVPILRRLEQCNACIVGKYEYHHVRHSNHQVTEAQITLNPEPLNLGTFNHIFPCNPDF